MKTSPSPVQTPKELLAELHALVNEAEKMLGASLSEHTDEAMHSLRARYDAAQERLGVLYTDARQRVVAGAQCADEAIRTHPYQSLALAAAAGLLFGVLLGRRTR